MYHIAQFEDAVKNCRFCFMCRHLSGTANVTFRESDVPRVRAAMLDAVLRGAATYQNNPDLIDVIYADDLSAACRFHCVSHYDENSLNLAARRDIVDAGLEGDAVRKIAADLEATANWTVSGPASSDVLYFEDQYTAETGSVPAAAAKLFAAKGVAYRTVSAGCIGKALRVLGYWDRSANVAKKFAAFVNGLNAKTLVVSNPAAYDALVNDYKEYGVALNVRVVHSSEFFADVKFSGKAGTVYYLESDFLRNYCACDAPGKMLAALGAECKPFGTNNEESYSAGEGALVLPLLNGTLARKLAERVESRADDPANDVVVTASPYTKVVLSKNTSLKVVTLEELAAGCL